MAKQLPDRMTTEILGGLTLKHVRRYSNMIRAAEEGRGHNIRIGECHLLLKIWEEVASADGSLDPTKYTDEALREIREAFEDEG